ncbi:hypothetical protein NPIL_321681, partial [Nephila pilipes]
RTRYLIHFKLYDQNVDLAHLDATRYNQLKKGIENAILMGKVLLNITECCHCGQLVEDNYRKNNAGWYLRTLSIYDLKRASRSLVESLTSSLCKKKWDWIKLSHFLKL